MVTPERERRKSDRFIAPYGRIPYCGIINTRSKDRLQSNWLVVHWPRNMYSSHHCKKQTGWILVNWYFEFTVAQSRSTSDEITNRYHFTVFDVLPVEENCVVLLSRSCCHESSETVWKEKIAIMRINENLQHNSSVHEWETISNNIVTACNPRRYNQIFWNSTDKVHSFDWKPVYHPVHYCSNTLIGGKGSLSVGDLRVLKLLPCSISRCLYPLLPKWCV